MGTNGGLWTDHYRSKLSIGMIEKPLKNFSSISCDRFDEARQCVREMLLQSEFAKVILTLSKINSWTDDRSCGDERDHGGDQDLQR